MYDPDANEPPVNPLPPVVILLTMVMGCTELLFQLGSTGLIGGPTAVGWRSSIVQSYGFSTGIAQWMWENQTFPLEHMIRFVSYPFFDIDFGGTLFGITLVLALGKFVGDRVSGIILTVIFFGSAVIAAVGYSLCVGPQNAIIGAHAPAYGLIGAFTWMLLGDLKDSGDKAVKAFRLIGMLALLHVVFFFIFGGNYWINRTFGFLGGFLICALLQPKAAVGFYYWVERMRNR